MKKLVSLLLALLMVLSLVPVMASAATITIPGFPSLTLPDIPGVYIPDIVVPDNFDIGGYIPPNVQLPDASINIPGYGSIDFSSDGKLTLNPSNGSGEDTDKDPTDDAEEVKKEEIVVPVYYHDPNNHSYTGYGCDTKYHWLECICGCKISMERHVDPKSTPNDVCTCGYKFSDNADLSVLWIDGAFPINNFNKDVTEYEVKAHTYKEFKEAKISTFTYDSEATVEYPKDLTLKAGKNVFEIKVTAENQKVTKTYTVTVVK